MDLFLYFFQAEDGIRDHCVTGVQTCALPIYWRRRRRARRAVHPAEGRQFRRIPAGAAEGGRQGVRGLGGRVLRLEWRWLAGSIRHERRVSFAAEVSTVAGSPLPQQGRRQILSSPG